MKHGRTFLGLSAAALLTLGSAACGAAAQELSRTLLYTLDPGETIMNNDPETLALDPLEVVLITTKGKGGQGPFFVLRDGARKGPFASTGDAVAAAYPGGKIPDQRRRDCAAYLPGAAPAGSELSASAEKGGQVLRFKGAALGPHAMFLAHKVTPDGAVAYVTAMDDDKSWFESSDGRRVPFGGTPVDLKFSPDGKHAVATVDGRLSMNEMKNLATLPPEKAAAAVAELDKKWLYTIDGKAFGPFDSLGGVWFARTGNDLYFTAKGQLLRNGVPVPGVQPPDPCDFYPSADGTSYAVVSYESIAFSDGKTFPSPLNVSASEAKGKTIYRWIALEHSREIVVYQRTM